MTSKAEPQPEAIVALTTVGSEDDAKRLVTGLVEDRLVACGTLLPRATSIFRWEGTITEEEEVLVILKTTRHRWPDLRSAIHERHPYDIPELLALPIDAGWEPYLDWVAAETGSREGKLT